MSRTTAKQSFIKIAGTRIEVTKVTPKITRELADTTDSSNYDPTSDLIQPSQLAVKSSMELALEGRFYLESTPTTFVSWGYSGSAAQAVILNLTTVQIFGHGNFDLSDFEAPMPIIDTEPVNWTATLKQNGVFTPNA